MPTPGLEHDKIQAQKASNVLLKSMLKRVWWCKRSNLEVEPFVAQWIFQMEENTWGLGVVKDHMSPWGVVKKEMCCCQFMLRLQEGRDVDQP
jgi:hypothetical protein